MTTPTTPANPNASAKIPPAPAPAGPRDVDIPAGKTVVLVNSKNQVCFYEDCIYKTRIYTNWSINTYDNAAAALADIAKNGWQYTPPPQKAAPTATTASNSSTNTAPTASK